MASILFKNRHWKLTCISVLCGTILAHFLFNGLHTLLDRASPVARSSWSDQQGDSGHRAQIVSRKLDESLVHNMVAEDHLEPSKSKLDITPGDKNTDNTLKIYRQEDDNDDDDDVVVGAVPYNKDNHKNRKTNIKHTEINNRQTEDKTVAELYDEAGLEDLAEAEVDKAKAKAKPGKRPKETAYYFDEPDHTDADSEDIFDGGDFHVNNKDDDRFVDNKGDNTVDEEFHTETSPQENYQKSDATEKMVADIQQKAGSEEVDESFGGVTESDTVKDKPTRGNHAHNLISVDTVRAHAQERGKRRMNKVILLAYMRSGSSYVGSLLERSPEVFYYYEPLYSTQINFGHWEKFRFLDGRNISESVTMDTTQHTNNRRNRTRGAPEAYFRSDSIAVRMLKTALDCRFHDLDLDTLSQVTMGLSAKTVDLRVCAASGSGVNDLSTLKQCCDNASRICRKSSTVVAKVIRMSMQQAQAIMEEDEDVKLIHLVRDPRGMSLSQVYRRFYPWEFRREVGNYCSRIWQDVQHHAKLAETFPLRTLLVRYEDVVQEPIKAMQQIYDHIGIHFGPLLQQQTLRMSKDKNRPHAWRSKIDPEQAAIVEKNCASLFHTMGYREFPNRSSVTSAYFKTTDNSFAEGWPGAVVLVGEQPSTNVG